jgi:hypothetical protein
MGKSPRLIELRPNFKNLLNLRWDYVTSSLLPPELYATQLSTPDILLVADCASFAFAPQFTWTYKENGRRSDGVISFLGPNTALGMKWNNAMGSREQTILR